MSDLRYDRSDENIGFYFFQKINGGLRCERFRNNGCSLPKVYRGFVSFLKFQPHLYAESLQELQKVSTFFNFLSETSH